jgi:hypothetical protein
VVTGPEVVTTAFHAWVTAWPAGKVQVSVQPLIRSPRLVIVTFPWKPPVHWPVTS